MINNYLSNLKAKINIYDGTLKIESKDHEII